MVQMSLVHRIMERETPTNILFLDACRNNPLTRNLARAMGTRSADIGRGLAKVESGVGTLISFSTQPDNVALDGTDRNSPYTEALLKHITSNDGLNDMLIDVRNDVRKATQNKQVPWENSALTGRFYFNPLAKPASPPVAAPQPALPPASAQPALSEAAQAWIAAEKSSDPAILEAFIKHYGDTFYGATARSKLAELKKRQAMLTETPAAPPSPAQPAAEARRFELSKAFTLKLQDTFITKDPSTREPLDAVIKDLTELSGGKLAVNLLPSGSVVPAFQALDAVDSGVLDAAWVFPSYWYGRSKAFGLVAGTVPGGLEASAFVRWIEAEGAAESNRLIAEVAKKKAHAVPCGLIGPGGEWFKRPIQRIDDFKGLKFRTLGLSAEIAKEIGAVATVLPAGEIIPAMDRGIIDATDWTSLESAAIVGLPDVSKLVHYPGWTRPVHLLELLINQKVWNELGRSGQQGVEGICRRNLRLSLDKLPDAEKKGLDDVRSRGVTVQPYPSTVLQSIASASRKVLNDMAQQDPAFARVLASYDKFR
jgi:TRAP-type mannitol/chloroaromatic compound transport system substrate-binding protein